MTDGAIDQDWSEAERDARDQLLDDKPDVVEPMEGGLAFDLVTRQLLFVRQRVADDLVEYYEAESFDLLNYKMHPYLGVAIDDAVFECVFLSDINAEGLHDVSSSNTYDYPTGRLAVVPIHEAWNDD